MLKYVLKRLAFTIPIIVVVPFAVFVLLDLAPGDAAASVAGEGATADQIATVRQSLHLDDPLIVRFARWGGDALHGSLGTSFTTHDDVTSMIKSSLPTTVSLVILTLIVTLVVGVGLGVWAGYRPNSLADRVIIALSSLAIAVPGFWLGLMLVLVFALKLGWLPAVGYVPLADNPLEWFKHLLLPSISLATLPGAAVCLQTRAALADELNKDYILSAIARGLTRPNVVLRHALKNAGVPVVTLMGYWVGQLIVAAVIIEQVFNLHGLGQLLVQAASSEDIPLLLGLTLITTTVIVVANLLVDLSYGYFNPRVRATAVTA